MAVTSSLPAGPNAGALRQLMQYSFRPEKYFKENQINFGNTFTGEFKGFGKFVFLSDPDAIHDVFHGDPKFLLSGEGNDFLKQSLGNNSLLVLEGEEHARQRKPLMEPFDGSNVLPHAAVIKDATCEQMNTWRSGKIIRLEDEFREITLQVILRTVFGLRTKRQLAPLSAKLQKVLKLGTNPNVFMASLIPDNLKSLTVWRSYNKRIKEIDEDIYALIDERRKDPDAKLRKDALSLLIKFTREDGTPLSDEELRDQLYTLLMAGHDTTAVALAWAFEQILLKQSITDNILTDIDTKYMESGSSINFRSHFPYLESTIYESLRFRPVVPFVARKLKVSFEAGGIEYPAGVHLAPCAMLTHTRNDLFPKADKFIPHRFLEQKPDPNSWLPFGGGRRKCIGTQLALFEMKVVIATILQRSKLELVNKPSTHFARRGFLLAPPNRLKVKVKEVSAWI